jgi:hypothetical protein
MPIASRMLIEHRFFLPMSTTTGTAGTGSRGERRGRRLPSGVEFLWNGCRLQSLALITSEGENDEEVFVHCRRSQLPCGAGHC